MDTTGMLRNNRRPPHAYDCIRSSPGSDSPVGSPALYEYYTDQHHADHRHDGGILSEVKCDKNKFEVNLDMEPYQPGEINVKTVGRFVVIEGNHEERQNVHNFTSRHFVRRYLLPTNAMAEEVEYNLSPDGILKIEVARGGIMKELLGTEHAL